MSIVEAEAPSPQPRPAVLAGDTVSDRPPRIRDLVRSGPRIRAFASAGAHSVVLIVITLLLILVVLPAALVAAGS